MVGQFILLSVSRKLAMVIRIRSFQAVFSRVFLSLLMSTVLKWKIPVHIVPHYKSDLPFGFIQITWWFLSIKFKIVSRHKDRMAFLIDLFGDTIHTYTLHSDLYRFFFFFLEDRWERSFSMYDYPRFNDYQRSNEFQ